jgi:murein DD-endopeptidase MepM/ murein hydrolase activator NlpD
MYLHLSSFGPGVRVGAHVDQGQMLGRVGMTGAATGPHLDYRVKKNGVHVNPLVELGRMPAAESLSPDALDAFSHARDAALDELTRLAGTHLLQASTRH